MTFIDKINPKKTLYTLDFINGSFLFVVFIYSQFYKLDIPVIIFINVVLAITITLFSPVSNVLIPIIMEKDDLVKANSIDSMSTTITQIAGPILGVVLFQLFGINLIILINAISFIISGILEIFIKSKKTIEKKQMCKNRFKDSIKELTEYINKENSSFTKCLL